MKILEVNFYTLTRQNSNKYKVDIEELDASHNFESTILTEVREMKSTQNNCNGYATPQTDCGNEYSGFEQISSGNENELLPETPNKCTLMEISNSSIQQLRRATTTEANTEPTKCFEQRVQNPFDEGLIEKLYSQVITSPSLFHRPPTPPSTFLKWTINEEALLNPVHIEAHESQFFDSPDPEHEAKAQSAIWSFFKEQKIVPSPDKCSLLEDRIILSEPIDNNLISTPGRRIRDCESQTELTLPFNLPKELEDALKPYFQPQLAGIGKDWPSHTDYLNDLPLRRELYDMANVVIQDENAFPQNESNILPPVSTYGNLSDSSEDSSICDFFLPLLENEDGVSFPTLFPSQNTPTKRKTCIYDSDNVLSPIQTSLQRRKHETEHTFDDLTATTDAAVEINNFSSDRSSSPVTSMCWTTRDAIGNFSSDSFKISRLAVHSANCENSTNAAGAVRPENELFLHDGTGIQRNKRRSAGRKNLFKLYSSTWLEEKDSETHLTMPPKLIVSKPNDVIKESSLISETTAITDTHEMEGQLTANQRMNLYRTDSDFNEMTSSSLVLSSQDDISSRALTAATTSHDSSMSCCSNPTY